MEEETAFNPVETCPNGHRYNAWKYGDTCPVCGAKLAEKEKNEEEWQELLELPASQWTCGVLLCLKGINKGRAYTIKNSKNFVGSDPNMDICIRGDEGIVKKNHGVVMYDELKRKTWILPGESKGMIYINQMAIYQPFELQNYMKIELGNSEFMFFALCNQDFAWSDLEGKA